MKRVWLALLAALLLGPAGPGLAQSWPTRPIQIVVSSGAGGTADIMARIIGDKLSPVLGVLRVPDAARGVAAARSIETAVERIRHGQPRPFDLGRVRSADGTQERWFLGVLCGGFDAVVNERANRSDPGHMQAAIRHLYAEAAWPAHGWRPTATVVNEPSWIPIV